MIVSLKRLARQGPIFNVNVVKNAASHSLAIVPSGKQFLILEATVANNTKAAVADAYIEGGCPSGACEVIFTLAAGHAGAGAGDFSDALEHCQKPFIVDEGEKFTITDTGFGAPNNITFNIRYMIIDKVIG